MTSLHRAAAQEMRPAAAQQQCDVSSSSITMCWEAEEESVLAAAIAETEEDTIEYLERECGVHEWLDPLGDGGTGSDGGGAGEDVLEAPGGVAPVTASFGGVGPTWGKSFTRQGSSGAAPRWSQNTSLTRSCGSESCCSTGGGPGGGAGRRASTGVTAASPFQPQLDPGVPVDLLDHARFYCGDNDPGPDPLTTRLYPPTAMYVTLGCAFVLWLCLGLGWAAALAWAQPCCW